MARNHMSRLGIFVGTWNTTGEVYPTDGAPGGTLSATDTYRWLPGGHFLIHEADARFGREIARSLEVVGYDAKRRKYLSHAYDDRGNHEEFEVRLTGRRWQILGERVRFDGKFSVDGSELTGLWELKGKRRWQPWIKLQLSRAW
jgi:hypothetical protein